ncbi:HCP-like protein [Backusella circina FSU 941]|nr:HCP-like protein [Backusella circina FSU 941]
MQNIEEQPAWVFFQIEKSYYSSRWYHTAMAWFIKSSERGHAESQRKIGIMYQEGFGVDVDMDEALENFHRSVYLGSKKTSRNIYYLYLCGFSFRTYYTSKWYNIAMAWFIRVSKKGHAEAQQKIGVMYQQGFGVDKDEQVALEWFHRGAWQGSFKAHGSIRYLQLQGFSLDENKKSKVLFMFAFYRIRNNLFFF